MLRNASGDEIDLSLSDAIGTTGRLFTWFSDGGETAYSGYNTGNISYRKSNSVFRSDTNIGVIIRLTAQTYFKFTIACLDESNNILYHCAKIGTGGWAKNGEYHYSYTVHAGYKFAILYHFQDDYNKHTEHLELEA